VLMSGYNDAVPPRGSGFRILRKPVPGNELHNAICDALAGRGKTTGAPSPASVSA
jgi:hypothetical protein